METNNENNVTPRINNSSSNKLLYNNISKSNDLELIKKQNYYIKELENKITIKNTRIDDLIDQTNQSKKIISKLKYQISDLLVKHRKLDIDNKKPRLLRKLATVVMNDNFDIEDNDYDDYDNKKSKRNHNYVTSLINIPDYKLKDLLESEERAQLVFDCLEIDGKIEYNTIFNYFIEHSKLIHQNDEESHDETDNKINEGHLNAKSNLSVQKINNTKSETQHGSIESNKKT